jgi:hypothetical protein
MSESTLPLGSGGPDGSTGPARNRTVLLVVGLGLVLAVGAAAWLLLFSGDGGSKADASVPAKRTPRPTASPTPTGDPVVIPATFDGSVGRNPFKPLVFPPDTTAGQPSAPALPPSTTPTLPPTWPTFPTTAPSASPTATPTPSATPTPRQWYVVALSEADPEAGTAAFYVNKVRYDVAVTKTFGPALATFKLISVNHDDNWGVETTYAMVQYGDESFVMFPGLVYQF